MTSPDSFEPKWTPGTLAYIDALCKTHHQPTYSELAAAVLAHARWNDDFESPGSDDAFDAACVELNRLAERLRMIGADE